jgi:hypothetical protein
MQDIITFLGVALIVGFTVIPARRRRREVNRRPGYIDLRRKR